MVEFLVRYIVVAVLGASLVWLGVPKLKAKIESPQGQVAMTEAKHRLAAITEKATPPASQPPAQNPFRPETYPGRVRAQQEAANTTHAAAQQRPQRAGYQSAGQNPYANAGFSENSPNSAGNNARRVVDVWTSDMNDGTVMVEEPEQPLAPVVPGEDWGILGETATSYTAQGTPTGKVFGGTVVERISLHDSSSGRMARCRILQNQSWREGIFVLESALVMFEGPFANAPKPTRDRLIRYFTLKSQIADRSKELKNGQLNQNPHLAEYRAAAMEMKQFQEKTKELTAQRDRTKGAARGKIDDELRRMKNQQTLINQRLKKAEGPYKAWKERNARASVPPSNDAQIRAWQNEMATLEPEVRSIVRGL